MPVLHNIKIEPLNNAHAFHKVIYDGIELQGVRELFVSYFPNEIPQAQITLNTVSNIDEDMLAKFEFDPESITECAKFLYLECQLHEELKEAFVGSVYSAVKELESKENMYAYDKAKFITDRIFGWGV